MKLVTISDVHEEAKYLRVLGYGEPGVGKTTFGASAALDPETAPCLFVEYRAQITTLRANPEFAKAIENGNLIILRLDKYDELSHIYTWLERGRGSLKALDQVMEAAGHADDVMPKTVVIDSLTELQRTEVMRRAGNTEGKFTRDVKSPEIRDWGALLNQFTLLAHLFFQLPYHIIFLGLEDVDFGDHAVGETAPIEGYRVALQGAAKRQFPAYALVLMRFGKAPRNVKAYNVGYTQEIKAASKDQTGVFPDQLYNPTIPKMAKLLKGGD